MDDRLQREGNRSPVKSVEKTIRIIGALEELGEAGVTEISDFTNLPKGTVHKHISSLLQGELICKNSAKYRLSLRFSELGKQSKQNISHLETIQQHVHELARETELITHFSTQEHGYLCVICSATGKHGAASRMQVAGRFPLHWTAAGKAILSTLPKTRVQEIINNKGLVAANEQTIIDPQTLFEELEEIKQQGYATNINENTSGLWALGAPVSNRNDQVIGALGVGGPEARLVGERFETELPKFLLGTVNELELDISYS